jgi:hypothetical protein
MSFQGINGAARYRGTPVEEVLPVELEAGDDRVEVPQGFLAAIVANDHPILSGIPGDWPPLLGYNRLRVKADSSPPLWRRSAARHSRGGRRAHAHVGVRHRPALAPSRILSLGRLSTSGRRASTGWLTTTRGET